MTSLLCDFGLKVKRNKRFQGEREREWVLQNGVWAREKHFLSYKGSVESVDTSFFKATVRSNAQMPNS